MDPIFQNEYTILKKIHVQQKDYDAYNYSKKVYKSYYKEKTARFYDRVSIGQKVRVADPGKDEQDPALAKNLNTEKD